MFTLKCNVFPRKGKRPLDFSFNFYVLCIRLPVLVLKALFITAILLSQLFYSLYICSFNICMPWEKMSKSATEVISQLPCLKVSCHKNSIFLSCSFSETLTLLLFQFSHLKFQQRYVLKITYVSTNRLSRLTSRLTDNVFQSRSNSSSKLLYCQWLFLSDYCRWFHSS